MIYELPHWIVWLGGTGLVITTYLSGLYYWKYRQTRKEFHRFIEAIAKTLEKNQPRAQVPTPSNNLFGGGWSPKR